MFLLVVLLFRCLISFACFIVVHIRLFAKFWTVSDVGNCGWFAVPGGRRSSGWRRVAEGARYSSWTDGAVVPISSAWRGIDMLAAPALGALGCYILRASARPPPENLVLPAQYVSESPLAEVRAQVRRAKGSG